MTTDGHWTAADVIAELEAGNSAAVWARLDEGAQARVSPDTLDGWDGGLTGWIGTPRRVFHASSADDDANAGHVRMEGANGTLRIDVRRTDDGRISAIELQQIVTDGIRNIVIGSPHGVWNEEQQRAEGAPRELGTFYAGLLGARIIRDDWIKVATDPAVFPHLAFGDGWSDERPARWDDPDYPQQAHLDVYVPDVDAAEAAAVSLGATRLRDFADHRVVADPFGHAICLYPEPDARHARLACVTFDCADPQVVADFWAGMLDMPVRIADAPAGVVIGRSDGRLPHLGFQRVDRYVAPRWMDPLFPAQMHLDLHFNDPAAARARAETLGATRLESPRGSPGLFADPAGHPFCVTSSTGTDDVFVLDVLAG
jgi:hypothetical protein